MNESQTKSELNPFIESGRKNDTFEHHSGNIREGFTKKNTEKSPSTPPPQFGVFTNKNLPIIF